MNLMHDMNAMNYQVLLVATVFVKATAPAVHVVACNPNNYLYIIFIFINKLKIKKLVFH